MDNSEKNTTFGNLKPYDMSETVNKTLRDSAAMRWTALLLLALGMFCAYIFMDILSPIKDLMESTRGWDSKAFGTMQGAETFLNVFVFFLIFAGIILDKMGVRFTAVLSGAVMLTGGIIKYFAVSDAFMGSGLENWFTNHLNWHTGVGFIDDVLPFYQNMPASAKLAAIGFMIFGCGCEMAGTTVSKILAKWFKGKEMALAMGLEMAIARLGVFAAMWLSPMISERFAVDGTNSVVAPLLFSAALLVIGLLNFFVFTVMDKTLDRQELNDQMVNDQMVNDSDEFHVSDLKQILTSKMFWIIALLCVLYYSAIFPFQRFATNFLEETLAISNAEAAGLFKWFPILAMVLTPFLGAFIDYKGKGASMMLIGAVIMTLCHLVFAFVLPAYPSKTLALITILILGVSFSLVPASMWPSVPKIIDEKVLGSAYCLIFWVQNVGLCLVPLLIGKLRVATNGYLVPMIVFASFGVLAFLLSLALKVEDKKKNYGLELPNKK